MNETGSRRHAIFGWLCLLTGYCFTANFPLSYHPLGGLVLIWLLFGGSSLFLWSKRPWSRPIPTLAGISALALSLAGLWLGDGDGGATLCRCVFLWGIAAYLYWLSAGLGNATEPRPGRWFFFDILKALFVLPFQSIGALFPALGGNRGKKAGKAIMWALLGLFVAMIPALIVGMLLGYDDSFRQTLGTIFSFLGQHLFLQFFYVIFAIPVAMYLYGAAFSAGEKKGKEVFSEQTCEDVSHAARFLPLPLSAAGMVPFFFLYAVFFFSQWQYYTAAFTGTKPEGFSYASYAREGFFQLCAVVVFNLVLLLILAVLTKRQGKGIPHRVMAGLLSVFTLILIATALSKMILYINQYGLTPDRVYASVFLLFLGVCFLLILLRQVLPRLNPAMGVLITAFVLCGALAFCEPDARIAQYNVDAYLSGRLTTVDMDAMENLGDSAVPQVLRLAEELEEKYGYSKQNLPPVDGDPENPAEIYRQAVAFLQEATQRPTPPLAGRNLAYFQAQRALQRWIES